MLSKNKERRLIEMYPYTDDEVIAKQLGVGLWVVRRVAEQLELKKEEPNEWTGVQIDYLIRNYKHFSNDLISEELGRSKTEIAHFAFRMGLSKNPDYFSKVIITREDREQVKTWSDEYSKEIGSSRGNYVLGKILNHLYPLLNIEPEYPIGNLRLDYYLPRIEVGFEFQGIQHTKYNNFHFASKTDFYKAQDRDYRKSEMCEQLGIAVVYVDHDEELSIALVKAKIGDVI